MKCNHSNNDKLIFEFNKAKYKEPYDCGICHSEIKYEVRLAQVLSKFEWNNTTFSYKDNHQIFYDTNNEQFEIPFIGVISLETVESLLKDIGECNNE